MFRLATFLGEGVDPHEREFRESCGEVIAGGTTGFVLVKHDENPVVMARVPTDQVLLRRREAAAHEGDHLAMSELVLGC